MTRELVRDAFGQPVENLCTNPSFERVVPGTTIFRRNLAINPGFKRAATGTTVVRRNIWAGSRLATTLSGGAVLTQGTTVDGRLGDTFTQGSVHAQAIYRLFVALAELRDGVTYTASATIKNLGTEEVLVTTDWCDIAGPDAYWRLAPGETRRVHATSSRPQYGTVYRFADFQVQTLGGAVHISEQMVEARPVPLPFFDGNTPNTLGIACSFEGAANASPSVAKAAAVEVWRNLAKNPSLAVNSAGWTAGTPAGITGTRNPVGPSGPTWDLTLPATIGEHLRAAFGLADEPITVNAGQVITVALDVYAPNAANGVYVQVTTPTTGGTTYPGTLGASVPQGWSRYVGTFTVPANTTGTIGPNAFTFMVPPGQLVAGSQWRITRATIVLGPHTGAYFDGDTTPDADLAPAWLATAGSSQAVLHGVEIGNVPVQPTATRVIKNWARGGLRIIPTGTSNFSFAHLTNLVPNMNALLAPGTTWTILARLTLDGPLTGSLNGSARKIAVNFATPGGNVSFASAATLNAAGVYQARLTFTVPADRTMLNYAILMHGSSNPSESVYWNDFALVPGPYDGPYFDGDTIDNTGIAYGWESTAHGSASTAKAALVEVRRNLMLYPSPVAVNETYWTQRWFGSAGGTGTSTIESGGFGGRRFYRKTWTNTPGGPEDTGIVARMNGMVAGKVYTVLMRIRASAAVAIRTQTGNGASLRVDAATLATGGTVVGVIAPNNAPYARRYLVPGEWTLLRATFTMPEGYGWINFFPYIGNASTDTGPNWAAGDTLDAMDALVIEGDYAGEYFDGDTSPDADLVPGWAGAVGASPSALLGAQVDGIPLSSARAAVLSTAWMKRSRYSVRMIPLRSDITDNHIAIGGDTGGFRLGMRPGGTYTALATMRLAGAQTGNVATNARRIRPIYRAAAGNYVELPSAAAPNAAGQTTLRHTFTIPADATEAFLRIQMGTAAGGGDMWVDELALIAGDYPGPYIDGDIPGCVWRGTPHASSSIGYPQLVQLAAA
ncbi:hypothetical protein BKA24_001725 [Microbacterium marinum]|uniref:Minor tail protein n=1 Tax=Microbacterium marinum TaxID=421115 RepID=A0A7W7BQK2_9MICO|nr:hypothetical protein [Microbacterium marinum]MBB4667016.1 hypothetical protein [Microbacterium marinum]